MSIDDEEKRQVSGSDDPSRPDHEDEKSIAPDNASGGSQAATDDDTDTEQASGTEMRQAPSQQGGVMSRVLSRITSRSSLNPGPPPDGGTKAWLVVFGSHLVVMNTWGIINSFGVFQSYYVDKLERSPSDISWVGSIEIFFLFSIGVLSGRMSDAGFFRPLYILGAVLAVLGTMMASICTQYWQTFLAQGVCVGIGNGLMFCPTIAVLSTYFDKKRALVIGIGACGSGTGGIIYPLMVRSLLPAVGFGWSLRAIGFIQAGTLAVAGLCLEQRLPPRKTGSLVDLPAFKQLEYTFYAAGAFMGLSYTTSLNMVVVMNGVGIVGRLIPTYLADRFGTLTVFVPVCGSSALLMFCWISVASEDGLFAWAAICGGVLGGIQSMFPAALASLTTDPSKQGTRIGMVFTIVSFSVLTGTPIAGVLISALDGQYLGAQLFSACSLTSGMLFLIAARESKRRKANIRLLGKV